MKIIGLTGPSGSGKSELCTILAKHGISSINADNVYHQLLSPPSACLDALTERFGNGILMPGGTLDRASLAKIVFAPNAEDELSDLNFITHKYVLDKIRSLISKIPAKSCPAVIVDAPTLFESGFDNECDFVVALLANKATRTDRIMKRDGISYEAAIERINAQKSDEFYIDRSDLVIYNNFTAAELEEQADRVLKFLEADRC